MNMQAPLGILTVTLRDPGTHCYLPFVQIAVKKEVHRQVTAQ